MFGNLLVMVWSGSPSGHLMTSAAVGYLLLMYAFEHPEMRFV